MCDFSNQIQSDEFASEYDEFMELLRESLPEMEEGEVGEPLVIIPIVDLSDEVPF